LAGICFNKFQQIKTYKTYSTLQGQTRGSGRRVKNGDPKIPTENQELGARVMDNECANASRRHPHKSMQPQLRCSVGQRSVSDSYSETAGWTAALPLAERSFTRKGKKILQDPNQQTLWFIKQKLKREGIT